MLVGANGALFAIRRSLFEAIPADGIVEDFLIALNVRAAGYRIVYDPEAIAWEEVAPNARQEFRRRVRIGAGNFYALRHTWRLLNPMAGAVALALWSHKVCRWTRASCPGGGADLGGNAGARTRVRPRRRAGWGAGAARPARISPRSPRAILGAGEHSVLLSLDEPRAPSRVDRLRPWVAVTRLDADCTDDGVVLWRSVRRGGPADGRPCRVGSACCFERYNKCGGDRVTLARLETLRTLHLWLPGYGVTRLRDIADRDRSTIKRVWVTIADHFEPWWRRADERTALERVQRWARRWPLIAGRHADAAGRPPCYTFFYPEEQYHPAAIDALSRLAGMDIADVEVHLHHDADSEAAFVDRVGRFIERLHTRHALLRRDDRGIRFGFIHGNWALDNSLAWRARLRAQQRDHAAAQAGLLRRFHAAVGAIAGPDADRQHDLLGEGRSSPAQVSRYRRPRDCEWRQSPETC